MLSNRRGRNATKNSRLNFRRKQPAEETLCQRLSTLCARMTGIRAPSHHLGAGGRRLRILQETRLRRLKRYHRIFSILPGHCHKPKQELLFAKLKARAPECAAAMMESSDRGQVLQRLEKVAKLVAAVFGEQEIPRHSFNAAVAEFVAHVRRHIELDEQKLYPAAPGKANVSGSG